MFDLNISIYHFQPKTPNVNKLQQKIKIIRGAIVNIVRNNYNVDLNNLSHLYSSKLYKLNIEIENTINQLKIDLTKKTIFTISVMKKV